MDASPLIKAYDHAQAAAVATRQSADTTVAVSEHALAAGEFAGAAQHTSSVEALRTLRLLEAHHRRLAELLRMPPPPPPPAEGDEDGTQPTVDIDEKSVVDMVKDEKKDGQDHHVSGAKSRDKASVKSSSPSSPHNTPDQPNIQQQEQKRRSAAREMSSSIASNLASARGIRSKYRGQPLSPSVSNDQAPGNVDPHPRRDGSRTKMQTLMNQQHQQAGKPTWVPPLPPQSSSRSDMRQKRASAQQQLPSLESNTDDAGYARFYNTFGSLINKISAPLAFAGLPLIQEEFMAPEQKQQQQQEAGEQQVASRRKSRTVPSPNAEPDLSKIYSKATMKALARQGHAPHESFYVVPSTGHTMSYANILSYAEKEKRRLGGSSVAGRAADADGGGPADDDDDDDDEEDDFVDAREPSTALSPRRHPRVVKKAPSTERQQLRNTVEELYTENQSLKDMLDKLSRRLHTFEASAQSSSMALAESYRLMRPSSPATSTVEDGEVAATAAAVATTTAAATAAAVTQRAQELEEKLSSATKQMERMERDNRKMQKTLDKYREKWELLKAGAKARRDGQRGETGEDVSLDMKK